MDTRQLLASFEISIHALREEGDFLFLDVVQIDDGFLSTPSARRATTSPCASGVLCGISIHALREEGDLYGHPHHARGPDISIHALREEGDYAQRMIPPSR